MRLLKTLLMMAILLNFACERTIKDKEDDKKIILPPAPSCKAVKSGGSGELAKPELIAELKDR